MSGAQLSDPVTLPPGFGDFASETVSLRAAFGLRFADAATGRLLAAAPPRVRLIRRDRVVEAKPNASGAMVAHRLPGPRAGTRILVTDPAGRFLAFSFAAAAPSREGWTLPRCIAGPLLPLARQPATPLGWAGATLRVTLLDGARQRPARCAVLGLFDGARLLARSHADDDGRVLLALPWPEPRPGPLAGQSWTRRLEVRWRADFAPRQPRDPDDPRVLLPDLCAMLSQPVARLRAADGAAVTEATIRHGEPTLLPTLFIDP